MYKAKEYMKIGFNFRNEIYYGIMAYFLYTCGYIIYHIKKIIKQR